jgi:hypothetical protein
MNPSKSLLITPLIAIFFSINISANYFPSETSWEIAVPEDEGVSSQRIDKLLDLSFSDNATQSVVVIKNGKLSQKDMPKIMTKIRMELHGLWQKAIMQL